MTRTAIYLGLLPGQSITVNVPLAFWDAGRINFTTDGAISPGGSDLLGPDPTKPALDQQNQPNPFRFFYANPDQNVVGSTTPGSQTLTFTRIYDSFQNGQPYTDPNKKLLPSTIVPGMGVSGPGIPANDTVQSLGADGNSITLAIAAIAGRRERPDQHPANQRALHTSRQRQARRSRRPTTSRSMPFPGRTTRAASPMAGSCFITPWPP